ncbi:tRNA pseudouridine(38-40) synthase TruA [Gammaproteobacteria bacterium]|nr:tRNA pseudouridine(38-40) synthase TruA [Gammaproteobacteria bacterium]
MRLALGVEYNGTHFHGWQLQEEGVRTVQGEIERALSIVANHPVRVFCAGRTDAGVHAIEQVIHFETDAVRSDKSWVFGCNVNLPHDVNVLWVKEVSDDFHARFDAVARSYEYRILNTEVRSSLNSDFVLWEPRKIDLEKFKEAAKILVGEHDFSSFRGHLCQAKSPIKNIEFIDIDMRESLIIINIKSNAFLHHMVRNIVGTLLKVGRMEEQPGWVEEVLGKKDRKFAGPTARPEGLYFKKAFYKNLKN